jgi:hypothetical protein
MPDDHNQESAADRILRELEESSRYGRRRRSGDSEPAIEVAYPEEREPTEPQLIAAQEPPAGQLEVAASEPQPAEAAQAEAESESTEPELEPEADESEDEPGVERETVDLTRVLKQFRTWPKSPTPRSFYAKERFGPFAPPSTDPPLVTAPMPLAELNRECDPCRLPPEFAAAPPVTTIEEAPVNESAELPLSKPEREELGLPNDEQLLLGIDAGVIPADPIEAIKWGYQRRQQSAVAAGRCWNCGRNAHPPSHAEQVATLKELHYQRSEIYRWPQAEFEQLLHILDAEGPAAYLDAIKAFGAIFYCAARIIRSDGTVYDISRDQLRSRS